VENNSTHLNFKVVVTSGRGHRATGCACSNVIVAEIDVLTSRCIYSGGNQGGNIYSDEEDNLKEAPRCFFTDL
jgi:hypothetical protein